MSIENPINDQLQNQHYRFQFYEFRLATAIYRGLVMKDISIQSRTLFLNLQSCY